MLRNSGGLSGMKSPENAAMAENFDLLPGNQPWGMAMDGDGGWSFCNPKSSNHSYMSLKATAVLVGSTPWQWCSHWPCNKAIVTVSCETWASHICSQFV